MTTKGESTAELVHKLSADGIKVNVTTIFTPEQCDRLVDLIMNRLEDVEDLSILGEYLKA